MHNYQAPESLLAQRNILITGAGSGIGRVAAKTFAAHGATVVLLGRTLAKLEAVYDEIEQAGHPKPALYPLDLGSASPDDIQKMVEALTEEFGCLHGILHNAGMLGKRTPLEQYDINNWYQVLQINLNIPFIMTRALLPLLEKAEDASVVFTSSGVGRKGRAFWGAYAVSKFATEGLMETWADELDGVGNIRVNCINPGATRTQMRAQAYPGEDPYTLATPEDIMPAYLYLMGADSKGVNGQSVDAQVG